MSTRSRETKARTDDTGDKPTVSQIALIRPLAGFCYGLAVLTIFWPDWIEALTGCDPDQHAGLVEWLIVIALLSTAPYWRSRRAPNGADRGPRLSSLD
jgi:hypothetical protein